MLSSIIGPNYTVEFGLVLPPDAKQQVQQRYQQTVDQVRLMRGQGDGQLVLQLFENDRDASRAIDRLSGALAGIGVLHLPWLGLAPAPLAIQEFVWAETTLTAIFSGAFVGATLGAFMC